MSYKEGIQAIPQIFSELNQLAHVELQYSATLKSYKVMTKIVRMTKECIEKEIANRAQEMKIFSTEQGIGLRKILLQNYQRLSLIMSEELIILDQVTSSIYEKHKSMENSLNFIEPVVREIEHKTKVLNKELTEVNQKVAKFQQIRKNKLSELTHCQISLQETARRPTSSVCQTSRSKYPKQTPQRQPNNSIYYSLFSLRKFDRLETETQFNQVQTFLELKRQEVEEFVRIEKELTQKTVQKIYQIFEQILGKGLEKLEIKLLNEIRSQNMMNQAISTPNISNTLQNQSQRDLQSSTDLQCYEKIEDFYENPMNFEKMKRVKKRLYHSTFIGGVDITESIEEDDQEDGEEILVSPTFNCVSPLIFESARDINQFSIQSETVQEQFDSLERSMTNLSSYQLFGSFSKENFNTMNF